MGNLKLDRRSLLKGSLLTGGAAFASGASAGFFDLFEPVKFKHGVASGDPTQHDVIIWTRVTPNDEMATPKIIWMVAKDRQFRRIVKVGVAKTDSSKDFTVKVDVQGLEPGRKYFYRFIAPKKHGGFVKSPVGRTLTLPEGDVDQFKMAVFSCSNYPAGFFHAYREASNLKDVDIVLHLGDYIYEYGMGGYATEDADALGRIPNPLTEIISLDDYRTRYGQYRKDPDLKRLHRKKPFICVWDDHEFTNDTYKDGAENHNEGEGLFSDRKAAALQAYYEWMPVREGFVQEEVYRSFEIGNLISLYMLDTRLIGRDQQLDYANYIDPTTGAFDAATFTTDITNPSRQLLGAEQLNWLSSGLATSTATWQVLGQQVLMGRMELPAPIATLQVSLSDYSALAALAQTNPGALTPEQLAILQSPSIPYNLDAWDGYAVQREQVLGTAAALNKNLVCLAGDTHNAWANNLALLDGTKVGVEFATAGVSSPGLEAFIPEDPAIVAAGVTQLIEPLKYANTGDRGFLTVAFTPENVEAKWIFVSTVKNEDYQVLENAGKTVSSNAGLDGREIIA